MPPNSERFLSTAEPDHWANFLWAISSADISTAPSLPWLPLSRRIRLYDYFSTPAMRNALHNPLQRALEASASRRLGIYFENLWAFAFEHHPDYRLLARNLPLRDGTRTLGELDFLVEHLPDATYEHWEVAVKFYLQVGDDWIGPGLKDRLDIKLERMLNHQLPVLHTSTGHRALDSLAEQQMQRRPTSVRQWTLMPGRLFRPLPDSGALPESACDYWWCTLETFIHNGRNANCRWHYLPKRAWLAPLTAGNTQGDGEQRPLDENILARGPVCVAGTHNGREFTRGFIVPADWHQQALERGL
ncbi:DUF1853 family protein [Microbulbifer sp. SA54]|uniref:DUF1853 family protein n=1 Tax=Microbulbifer sp. SA54 TaxID=3401577 RepID=UPI003AAADBF6